MVATTEVRQKQLTELTKESQKLVICKHIMPHQCYLLTLPDGFRSLRVHFHSLCTALEPRANTDSPEFVYNNRTTCKPKYVCVHNLVGESGYSSFFFVMALKIDEHIY